MSSPLLALKINVDTLRGTRNGVPRLVELLQKHGAQATFLFSLGPDNTGKMPRQPRPAGGRKKGKSASKPISRRERYGFTSLLYGTFLPAPDIGRRCAHILQAVHEAGFETGIQSWDRADWQLHIDDAANAWVEVAMAKAAKRYEDILGLRPTVHGATGWLMNRHSLRLTQRLGLAYGTDTRGTGPFLPVVEGELVACPQLPTTLPTLDELIGQDDITADNVAEHLLMETRNPPASGHVFTLHAELEGMKFLPVFEKLLEGWKEQGYALVACRQLAAGLDKDALPRCQVLRSDLPEQARQMIQGPEFLAA
jgi:peptidoglycan/xylan/chitin deacetylase (PgdA/CDA1 family)